MGLDIYLLSEEQRAAEVAHRHAWDEWYAAKTRGEEVGESPSYPSRPDVKSALHPSNINSPTYLRSSYNGGGFNSAVPKYLKDPRTTYHDIFAPLFGGAEDDPYKHEDDTGYIPVTDADAVRAVQAKAREIAARLRDAARTGVLTTIEVMTGLGAPMTPIEAIEWVEKALAEQTGPDGWAFTDRHGYIDPAGTTVLGVTQGGRGDILLVVKAETDGVSWATSYADSAEILAEEFCARMLDLIERDGKVYLSWSG